MDGSRFDTLKRVFSISRRSTVKALLDGALGAALTRGGRKAAAAATSTAPSETIAWKGAASPLVLSNSRGRDVIADGTLRVELGALVEATHERQPI